MVSPPELVPYLTGDGTEKRGWVRMAVDALAAVLSADEVNEDTKEGLINALIAGDLGHIMNTLIAAVPRSGMGPQGRQQSAAWRQSCRCEAAQLARRWSGQAPSRCSREFTVGDD
ncbi:Os02g0542800 [Oryza sativa Japonica Group]|nr:hypothetical protein OsJ_07063 [Oryza sativa Japonica Group]KAF2945196.1 hypothetical protein DAI22_02g200200 [Oryza sativa Japonica Group]BAS79115.1 Os02g0542800 [Oryza sativa Japonica Group]